MQGHSRRSGGFTLIESMVLVLVAAILAATALSARGARHERDFRDQLKATLGGARSLAIAEQRDVCVLLSATQVRAVYTQEGACSPALPVAERAAAAPTVLQVPGGVSTGGKAALRFNARGQPVPNVDQRLTVGSLDLVVSRETGIAR